MSHTNHPSDADYLHNPEVAHEHRDVDVRTVLGFAIGLFAVVVTVFLLMGGLFKILERQAAKSDPTLSPLARPAVQMPASSIKEPVFGKGTAGPQLITSEPTVLHGQQTKEEESLTTYGWIDEKAGVARIPVSEAKKLILQRGLPARAEGADSLLGTRRAAFGESSSGRTITAAPAPQPGTEQQETPAGESPAATPSAVPKGHGQ